MYCDDSAAAPNVDFADAIDAYAEDVLGTNQSVISTSTNEGLAITINTDTDAIDSVNLNLDGPYAKFKAAFDGYTVTVEDDQGEIQIINDGEPTNISEFLARVGKTVKNAVKADQPISNYNGTITIGTQQYDFTVAVNICDGLKALITDKFTSGLVDITYDGDKYGVTVNMDQDLFDVLGYSQAELKNAAVKDVVAKFAADGVLGKLITNQTERYYVDTLCDMIIEADNLNNFITENLKFTCDNKDVAFTSPTDTQKGGFQGLMEIISSAMATNFTDTVGSYSSSTVGGAINFKPMGIKVFSGNGANLFATINVLPVISYGQAVPVEGSTSDRGTVTVSVASALPGDSVTVTVTPANPGCILTGVSYMVGSDVTDLPVVATQSVRIKFVEGTHSFIATFDLATYTVTWKNGDVVLETDVNVAYGTTPTYDGQTPTKAETDKYTYEFSGWEPAISPVTGDITYQAVFTEITKPVDEGNEVVFISDSVVEEVTVKVNDITTSAKDTVVIGKDVESTADADNWTVAIPKAFFDNIAASKVEISMKDVSQQLPSDIPPAQAAKLKGMTVVSLMMKIGEKSSHQFGQKVTVKVGYTLKAGDDANNLYAYYVNTETGQLEKCKATYADGYASFETDHFSYWAIGGDLPEEVSKNSNLLLAIFLVSAIVLPIVAALVIYREK